MSCHFCPSGTGGGGGGGGSGDVSGCSFLVLSACGALTHERVFVAGEGLTAVDTGPNGTYTLSVGPSISLTGANNNVFIDWADGQNVAVSAAGHGRIIYNDATGTLQFSENGSPYADFVPPGGPIGTCSPGVFGRVAYYSAANTICHDADYTWDPVTKVLTVGHAAGVNSSSKIQLSNSGGSSYLQQVATGGLDTLHISGQDQVIFELGGSTAGLIDNSGNFIIGVPGIDGTQAFPYPCIETILGAPTGVPNAQASAAAIIIDRNAHRFYWYENQAPSIGWHFVQEVANPVSGTGIANQVTYWTGVSTIGGSTGFLFDGTQTVTIAGTAPVFKMTDTTAAAKSLSVTTDANFTTFGESATPTVPILLLDLANGRVGVGAGSTAIDSIFYVRLDQNTITQAKVINASGGAAAQSEFFVGNGTGSLAIGMNGTGFTTSGAAKQSGAIINTDGAGGMSIAAGAAATDLRLYAGGIADANQYATLVGSTGAFRLGVESSITGKLSFANSLSVNLTTFQAGIATSPVTYTLPTADSSGTQFLASNGAGTLSWATPPGTGVTGSGVANQIAYWTGATAIGGAAAWTFNGTDTVTIGLASTTTGKLRFGNAASANLTTFQAGNATAAVTYTLPTADSTGTQFLSSNGAGTLAWATPSGTGPTGTGAAGRLALWSGATTITSDAGFLWNTVGPTFTLSGTAPVFIMTDTTAAAKSLTITTDANFSTLAESATATVPILQIDLANGRVGIGANATAPSQILQVQVNQNTNTTGTITNTNAGVSALAGWSAGNGTFGFSFNMNGTGMTTSGASKQNGAIINTDGSGGFSLAAGGANTDLRLYAGGTADANQYATLVGATGIFRLGVVSSVTGKLAFANSGSANLTTFQAAATAAVVTYTLPPADSTGTQFLASNGAGTLSWTSAITGTGTSGQVAYFNGTSTITSAAGFLFDGTQTVTISGSAPVFKMTDTTAAAKSLTVTTDANKTVFAESAAATTGILTIDLSTPAVNIGSTTPPVVGNLNITTTTNPVVYIASTTAGASNYAQFALLNNSNTGFNIYMFSTTYTSSGAFQASSAAIRNVQSGGLSIVADAGTIRFYTNGTADANLAWQIETSAILTAKNGTGYIDLTAITAGGPNFKITATSDTPAVTWGPAQNGASTTPAGYIEILVGANARYVPFWA